MHYVPSYSVESIGSGDPTQSRDAPTVLAALRIIHYPAVSCCIIDVFRPPVRGIVADFAQMFLCEFQSDGALQLFVRFVRHGMILIVTFES